MKYITILFVILLSCNTTQQPMTKESNTSNYRLYHQYCFHNNICTDSMLVKLVILDEEQFKLRKGKRYENRYQIHQIERVDPTTASDEAVIQQVLKSLEIYNLSASRKKWPLSIPLDHTLFFFPQHFKSVYHIAFNETDFMTIENLSTLTNYNFKHAFQEIKQADTVQIIFENEITTRITCNQAFHEKVLFPQYLNFISKNHRLTPYQLGVEKLPYKN